MKTYASRADVLADEDLTPFQRSKILEALPPEGGPVPPPGLNEGDRARLQALSVRLSAASSAWSALEKKAAELEALTVRTREVVGELALSTDPTSDSEVAKFLLEKGRLEVAVAVAGLVPNRRTALCAEAQGALQELDRVFTAAFGWRLHFRAFAHPNTDLVQRLQYGLAAINTALELNRDL